MRTHMDVQEGYRPLLVTVKASDDAGRPGRPLRVGRAGDPPWPGRQIAGPPEVRFIERYAPGMGYPGDEGGGPPDSRLDARARRAALSSQSRAAQPWAVSPRRPAAPGEEEPGEAVGRRRAPATGPAETGEDRPAQLGYGGRSGYGGETSYPGGSSGSHRRPDGPTSSYPGPAPGPAPAGYAASPPAGTGYPPATQGTGHPPATPGTGYPPATRGTGAGRSGARRRREPGAGGQPGRNTTSPASTTTSVGPSSRENAWRRPERLPGQEIQGAPANGSAGGGSQPRGSLWSAGAFRTAGPGGRGPVRGFPPAPGAPDPVYPPGQFSPWNAPALRAASAAGRPGLTAGAGPETAEPGYPLLAVSDPSADATATQTWAVLDDAQLAGEWTAAPAGHDNGARPGTGEGHQTGPRGFFEPPDGPETPPGSPAPGTGTRGTGTRGTGTRGTGSRGRGRTRHTVGLCRPAGVRAPREYRAPRRGWFPQGDRLPRRAGFSRRH